MLIAYRRSIPFIARLLLALGLALGQVRGAIAEETMAEAMANAIARMMESMGFPNTGVGSAMGNMPGGNMPGLSQSIPYNPMGMTGLPSAFGTVPGMPGATGQTMPLPGSAQMNQMVEHFSRQLPVPGGSVEMPAGGSSLEGIWEDTQGGLLIVQGAHYRIYSACNGFIEGTLQVEQERIELTNQSENFTQTFEFALDQGRLALRNQSGEMFLYRRMLLGQGRGSLSH